MTGILESHIEKAFRKCLKLMQKFKIFTLIPNPALNHDILESSYRKASQKQPEPLMTCNSVVPSEI